MIFGRKKNDEPDDIEEEEEELDHVSFRSPHNGLAPNLRKHAKLVRAGLIPAKDIISDAVSRNANKLVLEPKGNKSLVKIFIDGFPYSGGSLPKPRANAVTQMVKLLAGLDIESRRKSQSGGMDADYEEAEFELLVTSEPAGGVERLTVKIQDKKKIITKPADAGIPDDLREKIREMGTHRNGIILVCGGRDSGTTSTALATLHSIDAYLYTLFALEDVVPESKLTNVGIHETTEGDDLSMTLQRVGRKEADVVLANRLEDEDTARALYEYQDKMTFVCEIDAPNPTAAIRQMVDWLGEEAAAAAIKCVITQKLIRKLCDECKEAYRPNPKLLQRLGLPKTTKVLYREPSPPDEDDPEAMSVEELCAPCNGLPYHGRVALFELIEVTEGMKKVIEEGADPSAIKKQISKDDMRTLQQDGLRLVAEGKTSLEELQRAFRKPGPPKRRRR